MYTFLFFLQFFSISFCSSPAKYVTTRETFLNFSKFPTVMVREAKFTFGMSVVPLLIGGARSIAPIFMHTEPTLCIPTIVYQSLIAGISWYAGYKDILIQSKVSFETNYTVGQSSNGKLLGTRAHQNFYYFKVMLVIHTLFVLYNTNCFWKKSLSHVAQNLAFVNLTSFIFVNTAPIRLNGKIPLKDHYD